MLKYSLNVNKGIWHVSFRIITETGDVKQKCLSTSVRAGKNGKQNKRMAEAKAFEIVSKYVGINFCDKTSMTLGQYVEDYVNRNHMNLQPSTYDGYIHMVNKHIKPYFTMACLPIGDIKPIHIQRYIEVKLKEGLSNNTVNKQVTLIKSALQDAVINDYIHKNPALSVKKPQIEKPSPSFYNATLLSSLMKAVRNTSMELPVFFAIMFALRRSEILGLKWSNIDFESKTLFVCEKMTRQKQDGGKIKDVLSTEMKTTESKSVYPLTDEIVTYLKFMKLKYDLMPKITHEYDECVCVNDVGEILKLDFITHKFNKILKANNFPHIKFHDLRHSSLSLLANDPRFTIKQVQDYARHANYQITADTYAHVYSETKLKGLQIISSQIIDATNETA